MADTASSNVTWVTTVQRRHTPLMLSFAIAGQTLERIQRHTGLPIAFTHIRRSGIAFQFSQEEIAAGREVIHHQVEDVDLQFFEEFANRCKECSKNLLSTAESVGAETPPQSDDSSALETLLHRYFDAAVGQASLLLTMILVQFELVTDVWGCGVARSILPGDRVFLHRVTQEPKGVFGSGYVTRAPYEVPDPHSKRGYRLCIDFVYDWLVDAHQQVVVTRDALRVHPFLVQTWDAQASGTSIKPVAEGALEKRWAELTGKRKPPKLDAPSGPTRSSKVSAHAAAKR